MHQITRRLEFDYGHRILGHESKCANLHGHRGRAEITVAADELDVKGRVVDFAVVKELIGQWIDDNWDHNMLLNIRDPICQIFQEDKVWFRSGGFIDYFKRPFLMECNPTAENIAEQLWKVCVKLLPSKLQVLRVRFYETPNNWADYKG